jgi:hypothetical protein
MNTRKTIFVSVVVLLLVLLGVWWYFGFSLQFSKFFAAEPSTGTPTGTCVARPACLDAQPRCLIAEPAEGWCPVATPKGTCLPRPACLDTKPACAIAEPAEGWCPATNTGMVACSPATQIVKVGALASLTATGGTGSYTWFAPQGNPTGTKIGTAAFSLSYNAVGTKKVTVQSARAPAGSPFSDYIDSVACTVIVQ